MQVYIDNKSYVSRIDNVIIYNKERNMDKKLTLDNWTVLELVSPMIGRKRIPLLKVQCSCSAVHIRSLEAVIKNSGYCSECGEEDDQWIPILNPYEKVKIGEVINSLIFQREQKFFGPNGRSYKSWIAICSLCQSEQRTNKYCCRERCSSCLGLFGKKFHDLKLISVKSKELNRRGPALGNFLCDCGRTEEILIQRVASGNLMRCKSCRHEQRKLRMHNMVKERSNALEENRKLKEELESYRNKNE